MPQTKMVLVTSPIDLAKALIYFVTVTPVMLNVAIEKTPRMQKISNGPLENAYEKYWIGLYKYGNPSGLKTQASIPNEQGMKVRIGNNSK